MKESLILKLSCKHGAILAMKGDTGYLLIPLGQEGRAG